MSRAPVAVLGAGAWGTALAIHVANQHPVMLWTRQEAHAQVMRQTRTNQRYLPGPALPDGLSITHDRNAVDAFADQGLVIIATPMSALAETLATVPKHLPVFWLCKGFESGSGRLGHEIAAAIRPPNSAPSGVLSGPSFALELAKGLPTALVAASPDPDMTQQAVDALHHGALRVYRSPDVVGVEVGGAVKNVLAIATGICDGLGLGQNARAALITRGLAEMTRLGLAMGAQRETFMGLTGLGDLVLTATGDLSRNRKVGLGLAKGQSLEQIMADLGHVAEGVYSAATVSRRAEQLGIEMPIVQTVRDVLTGKTPVQSAVHGLMSREAKSEI